MARVLWFSVALALLAAGKAPASSDEVVISTGRERGSYYYIGQRFKTELLLGNYHRVEVRTSSGSLDNLRLLDDPGSPVNVALAQADALTEYLRDRPDFQSEFFVLGDLGRECVFVIAGRKAGIEDASDLKSSTNGEISVDDVSSGSAVTWQAMTRLEPRFARTKAVYVPTMEALLQLKVGGTFTKLRAAMIVQRPRRASPPLETVMKHPDLYRLVPITSVDLPNAKLPDGSDVYTFERVTVGGKKRQSHIEVDTLCTRGLMLGSRSKLGPEMRSRLSTLMMEAASRIVGADE